LGRPAGDDPTPRGKCSVKVKDGAQGTVIWDNAQVRAALRSHPLHRESSHSRSRPCGADPGLHPSGTGRAMGDLERDACQEKAAGRLTGVAALLTLAQPPASLPHLDQRLGKIQRSACPRGHRLTSPQASRPSSLQGTKEAEMAMEPSMRRSLRSGLGARRRTRAHGRRP
jgi:hypothetical protein